MQLRSKSLDKGGTCALLLRFPFPRVARSEAKSRVLREKYFSRISREKHRGGVRTTQFFNFHLASFSKRPALSRDVSNSAYTWRVSFFSLRYARSRTFKFDPGVTTGAFSSRRLRCSIVLLLLVDRLVKTLVQRGRGQAVNYRGMLIV